MNFNITEMIELWLNLLNEYRGFGPFAPIIFVMLESIFPFLPLVLIITFNVSAYGVFFGFIYSFIGNVLGSILVFFIFRFFKHQPFMYKFIHLKRVEKLLMWVIKQHPSFLIFLFSSPFTPSSFVNVSFGLSGYSKRLFTKSLIIGKTILMVFFALFGYSLNEVQDKPYLLVLAILCYGAAYYLSQRYGKITGEEN